MELRGTMLQPWHWHTPQTEPDEQNFWQLIEQKAESIKDMGFTSVWLPPSSEGFGGKGDVGYGIKDWYNLNGTKYGDKEHLQAACKALKDHHIEVYHDQVHNHLMGGKKEKDIWCLHVKANNKNEKVHPDGEWFQADIYTSFPWLELTHCHFDAYHNDQEVWILSGKRFDTEAKQDALMGCDLDFDNQDLVKKLEKSGLWFREEVHVDGYRFDAVKHVRPKGTLNYLNAMRGAAERQLFAVGEYLDENIDELHHYIHQTNGQISLFDFPLQRKFVHASQQGNSFDMSSIFSGTLTQDQPVLSVPFVHSHDDQPPMNGGGHRGHYVGDWFVPHAYALILLREEGYPMVSEVDMIRHEDLMKRFMLARTNCTFGSRYDRFDHGNTIGWSFSGGYELDNSMAVVMTNGEYGTKWLPTHKAYTIYKDLTNSLKHTITTNEHGWGEFECPSTGTSVWVEESKYIQLVDQLNE